MNVGYGVFFVKPRDKDDMVIIVQSFAFHLKKLMLSLIKYWPNRKTGRAAERCAQGDQRLFRRLFQIAQ